MPMKPNPIIGISLPEFVPHEAEGITGLLEAGLCRMHIRKPTACPTQVQKLVKEIPQGLRNRLSVHYYPELIPQLGIGGAHHSFSHPIPIAYQGIKSKSCHSFDEVDQAVGPYQYLFLSPIFNSLSKSGYTAAFAYDELKEYLQHANRKHTKIIALGGIQANNIAQAHQLGFDGIAILGSLWALQNNTLDISTTLKNFTHIQQAWNNKIP